MATATNPIAQADHFLRAVTAARVDNPEKPRSGVLLVLDFEKNGHYPGGSMSVAQAVAFVERIKERTGKYPGLYGSENRLRQMLYGASAAHRRILKNCWLWIANYHAEPRNTAPWRQLASVAILLAMVNATCDRGACIRNRWLTSQKLNATFFAGTTPSCKHFGERTRGILRD